MNWKILNIEPTTDKERIRQAYAREVKRWHPEEHPEEFRMLRQAYRDALRLADCGDPRDAVRFAPQNMSQSEPGDSKIRQPGTEEHRETQNSAQQSEAAAKEKKRVLPEPEWEVDGRPAVRPEKQLIYKKLAQDFFVQCRGLLQNEIYANEPGSWDYIMGKEKYQKLYEQPRFWYEFAALLCDEGKTGSGKMDGAVCWYLWQRAKNCLLEDRLPDSLKKVLTPEDADRLSYEKAKADTDRWKAMHELMEQTERQRTEQKRQADLLTEAKSGTKSGKEKQKKGWVVWGVILLIMICLRFIASCYVETRRNSQPSPSVINYEQYEQYQQQQQYQVDPEKLQEAMDAMQSLQVTEQQPGTEIEQPETEIEQPETENGN